MPVITTGITMVFEPDHPVHHQPHAGRRLAPAHRRPHRAAVPGNSYNTISQRMSLELKGIVLLCMSFTTADTEEMEAMV